MASPATRNIAADMVLRRSSSADPVPPASTAFAHLGQHPVLDETARLCVCARTAASAVATSSDASSRLSTAVHACAGVAFASSASRVRASVAQGETLSRLRYSVHALFASAVSDNDVTASARLNQASLRDGSIRRARSAAARARGKSSGRNPSRARSSCTVATSFRYRALAGCSRDAASSDCAASSYRPAKSCETPSACKCEGVSRSPNDSRILPAVN